MKSSQKRPRRSPSQALTPGSHKKMARLAETPETPFTDFSEPNNNISLFSPPVTPSVQERPESDDSNTRAALLPKLVCWANWDEWREVKRCLFSSKEVDKGLKRVHTWRLRQHLPLSIDITASLIQLRQEESQIGSDISRLAYGMALVRMVNGLVDPQQTKLFAMSVSRLATQLGLPRCLVEVRHEATHKQLPSLPMLKYAAEEALVWLRENYWEEQERRIGSGIDSITLALQRYKKATEAGESKRATTQLKTLMGLDLMALRTELLPILASSLCATDDENSGSSVDARMHKAHNVWDYALTFLRSQYPTFTASLLLVLVQALSNPETHNREIVSRWSLFLVQKGDGLDSASQAKIVQMCLDSQTPECLAILKALPLPSTIRTRVNDLLQISQSPSPVSGPGLQTLEEMYKPADTEMRNCPLGLLLNDQPRISVMSVPQSLMQLQDLDLVPSESEEFEENEQVDLHLTHEDAHEAPLPTTRAWQPNLIKSLQTAIEIW